MSMDALGYVWGTGVTASGHATFFYTFLSFRLSIWNPVWNPVQSTLREPPVGAAPDINIYFASWRPSLTLLFCWLW